MRGVDPPERPGPVPPDTGSVLMPVLVLTLTDGRGPGWTLRAQRIILRRPATEEKKKSSIPLNHANHFILTFQLRRNPLLHSTIFTIKLLFTNNNYLPRSQQGEDNLSPLCYTQLVEFNTSAKIKVLPTGRLHILLIG